MYINRTQPDFLRPAAIKNAPGRKLSGEKHSESFASIIEMDVVEIGDSTEEKRREQPPHQQQRRGTGDGGGEQNVSPSSGSLDIKV